MASRTRAFLLSVCLLPLACRSYMPYTGRPLESTADARKVIYRVLDQQPGSYAPIQIEVTDEKFRVVRSRSNPILGTSGIFGTAVYYSNISNILLSEKRGLFAVTILASNGQSLLHVYTMDQSSAEQFIDAMATMRRDSGNMALQP